MNNTSRTARLELLLIGMVAIVFAVLELYIDSFQRLVIWATENEALLVTEIMTLAIVLSIGLSIYAWRRWREAILLEADKVRLQQTVSVEQDAKRLIQSYADAVTLGQEAERRRLARELHDDTIQRLIFLNQRVELAAFDHAQSSAASDLDEMQGVIDGIIGSLRQFIQELRPTYLDELGLVAALGSLAKKVRERSDLFVEFDVTGVSCRVSESIELALYRIVQSAVGNVIQHANASQVEVWLDFRPNQITLKIEDDGDGFKQTAEAELVTGGHFGLIGMRERAQLLGASYQIESPVGEGTLITVCVPLGLRPSDHPSMLPEHVDR
ncbi:MAG: sensor histidine kinase [Candidatus Promineifilaceae bacterium]